MQKNNSLILIVVVILAVLVISGIFIFSDRKSNPTPVVNPPTSSTAVNNSLIMTETNSTIGSYLADPNDNTLYTDGTGATGVTDCAGSCLSAWPIYQDNGSTTNLPANISTIKRSDNGEIQYTFKGKPLYYFTTDTPGKVTGNGTNGFYVARP
jgi:predicted lipoprotein with Yx(FWY)xxD motif